MKTISLERWMFLLWCLLNLVMAGAALIFLSPHFAQKTRQVLTDLSTFTGLQSLACISPLVTAFLIIYCHRADCRRNGRGLQARLRRIRGPRYVTDATFVSAAITKQSVIVAISIGTLLIVASEAKVAQKAFTHLVSAAAIVGLACSVVCTLVSMLCYDYAIRFKWRPDFREDLVRKGLDIEVWGWYLLTLSFVLSMGLLSVILSIVVNFLYGSLLLYYYFPSNFYGRKEKLWNVADAFITRHELSLEIASIHRASVRGTPPNQNEEIWNIEVFAPSSTALRRVAINEHASEDALYSLLAAEWLPGKAS